MTEIQTAISQARQNGSVSFSWNKKGLEALPASLFEWEGLKHLSLENNEIERVPADLGKLINLETLNLNGNKLKSLPNEIGLLLKLRRLDLDKNQLQDGLPSLPPTLEIIHLQGNGLKAVPHVLRHCSRLGKLNLANNALQRIDFQEELPANLQEALIGQNQITELKNLGAPKTLLELDLSDNQIIHLAVAVKGSKLERLILKGNQLKELSDSLSSLRRLAVMILDYNHLKTLPSWLGKLKQLNEISVACNQIETINWEKDTCPPWLYRLDLSGNRFFAWPHSLSYLSKLVSLKINKTPLTLLDGTLLPAKLTRLEANQTNICVIEALEKCTELERLELSGCQLEGSLTLKLPPKCSVINLENNNLEKLQLQGSPARLTEMRIAENRLKTISFDQPLPALRQLDLSKNQLSKLPDSLSASSALERIDLPHNCFSEVPQVLEGLPSLAILTLSYNQIGLVPDWLSRKRTLQCLWLDHNEIKQFPTGLTKGQKNKTWPWLLTLQGNPIDAASSSTFPEDLATLRLGETKLLQLPPLLPDLESLLGHLKPLTFKIWFSAKVFNLQIGKETISFYYPEWESLKLENGSLHFHQQCADDPVSIQTAPLSDLELDSLMGLMETIQPNALLHYYWDAHECLDIL